MSVPDLGHHDPRLVALATQAEEQFARDPEVCLYKLRKFGELLAQRAAAKVRMFVDAREKQLELVNRLHERGGG